MLISTIKPRYDSDVYLFQLEDNQGYCPAIPDWIDQQLTVGEAIRIYLGEVNCFSFFSTDWEAAELLNDYGDQIVPFLKAVDSEVFYGLSRLDSWTDITKCIAYEAIYFWVCDIVESFDLL